MVSLSKKVQLWYVPLAVARRLRLITMAGCLATKSDYFVGADHTMMVNVPTSGARTVYVLIRESVGWLCVHAMLSLIGLGSMLGGHQGDCHEPGCVGFRADYGFQASRAPDLGLPWPGHAPIENLINSLRELGPHVGATPAVRTNAPRRGQRGLD